MNNKPNHKKMQPDTADSGDSTINTKKGFLISLPSRKKKDVEPGSGIVMAAGNPDNAKGKPNHFSKPNGGENARDKAKAPRDGSKEAPQTPRDKRDQRDKREQRDQRDQREKNPSDRPQNGAPRRDRPQKGGTNASAEVGAGNPKDGARPERAASSKNGKDRDNRDNRENRENRENRDNRGRSKSGERGANAQNAQNAQNAPGTPERSGKPTKNDRPNGKNNRGKGGKAVPNNGSSAGQNPSNLTAPRGGKKGSNPNAGAQNGQGKGRRMPKMPSLSPLSGDMMSFARDAGNDLSRSSAKKAEREPSLEEKYKNAVPLAEQIAEEERQRLAKARKKVLAEVSHKPSGEVSAEADAQNSAGNGENAPENYEIVGIRFREAGKIYYFDPDGQNIPYGTPVIVETSRGSEYGYTAISNRLVPGGSVVAPLKKIKRVANATDTEKFRANKELESEAAVIFKQKVAELKLAMNLVFVEYTFDNSKLLFYFTAETRIDFRELVKELASIFRTRIELRQIGVRDEAKMLGGLGVCGRCVCCNSFLGDFAQVSIKMAKEQGLSLNSTKISGACGKLMCCLRFEDKVYSEEAARTPKVGATVETAEGKGTVVETNPLKGEIKVSLFNAPDTPPKVFDRESVTVLTREKTPNAASAAERAERKEELSEAEVGMVEEVLEVKAAETVIESESETAQTLE